METAKPSIEKIREEVIEVLRSVYDPEIPVNIYDLGLIYGIEIDENTSVKISMTLTSPMCPVAESLPPEVETRVRALPDVTHVETLLIWDPPWDPSKMTEAARLQLGM